MQSVDFLMADNAGWDTIHFFNMQLSVLHKPPAELALTGFVVDRPVLIYYLYYHSARESVS